MSEHNTNTSENTANVSDADPEQRDTGSPESSTPESERNEDQGAPQFGEPLGPRDPSFPLANLPESTETVRLRAENHEDRRKMRRWLFAFIVGASALFLLLGALMSVCITINMLNTKHEVKDAMLKVVNESSPEKVSEFVFKARPAPPESLYHARETAKELNSQAAEQRRSLIEKFLETTNWLSLSPMITLIAFILGVGLTLAIALMKALFREEEVEERSNTLSQIATPISKLFEYLIEFLQNKFRPGK
ncbi:hypothetical protein [Kluyvera sp. CRP]|uniref:hypothetical protein n=1 Tax=Kluyvera TaxID=579 RepID=UPI001CC21969|nr:hypothetical protein [Kluyvera sp. CRP]UAK21154.1 hypothetical protein K7B04_04525 [Kluyvera sp. CRP]HDU3835116.1 hypothetical protein [Klebsiella aerogenes]